MARFGRELRSATVRALGQAQVLSVDKRTFLRRISEDPALALRVTEKMAQRIRQLNTDVDRLEASVRELRQRPHESVPPLA
jgi:CRP-like cAMP-binding protein